MGRPRRSMSEMPFFSRVFGISSAGFTCSEASYSVSVRPTDAAVLSCAGSGKVPAKSPRVSCVQ